MIHGMSLHWYCPENGLTFLRYGKLAFRSLNELNDPLLLDSALKRIDINTPITDIELRAELKSQYQALPDHLRAMVDLEYFIQQAMLKREEIEAQIHERSRPSAAFLSEGQQEVLAVLSLYESADSIHLWAQKANSHRGMMISFKSEVTDFFSLKYKEKPQRFGRVNYSNHRPIVKSGQPLEPLFTRPECFANEQEWRLVRLKTVADKHLQLNDVDWFLYKLPFNQILSFTFGCQMNEAEINKIVTMVKSDLRYRHIALNRCFLDPLMYQLIIEPI
jgi:hypothetical protein